eukprot:756104-Hanusia_phi.AAC.2
MSWEYECLCCWDSSAGSRGLEGESPKGVGVRSRSAKIGWGAQIQGKGPVSPSKRFEIAGGRQSHAGYVRVGTTWMGW